MGYQLRQDLINSVKSKIFLIKASVQHTQLTVVECITTDYTDYNTSCNQRTYCSPF